MNDFEIRNLHDQVQAMNAQLGGIHEVLELLLTAMGCDEDSECCSSSKDEE